MTKERITQILNDLYILHIEDGDKIRIDFFSKDMENRIGYFYFKPNQIRGKNKPITQNIYVLTNFQSEGILDYINSQEKIVEDDFEVINKTIYFYCMEMLKKYELKVSY